MRISVVIPVFNRVHTLSRALDSVRSQSSPADEVIVVDDGSSDGAAEFVQTHYPEVRLIRQHNLGVSAARNHGISAACCDWIALLDSDDEWLPEKLSAIRLAWRDHPDEVLFHSDEIWIRNGKRVNPMNKHRKYGGMIFEQCLPLCVISPSAAVVRRSVFDKIGTFDESLPACEDYDLWLRLCHRHRVHYIDKPLIIKYGGHEDQLSRKYWGMDRFRIRALNKLIDSATLEAQQRDQAINMLISKLRILLKGAHKHDNLAIIEEFQPLLDQYEAHSC